MLVPHWQTVLLCALVSFGTAGCTGHYKFSDNEYRPLGEPMPVNRGK